MIKNPITSHLPVGCRKIGTSLQAEKLIHPKELVPEDESPIALVIGAMAHGSVCIIILKVIPSYFDLQISNEYIEETVAVSQYPLSAALACTKICSAFEEAWGIH